MPANIDVSCSDAVAFSDLGTNYLLLPSGTASLSISDTVINYSPTPISEETQTLTEEFNYSLDYQQPSQDSSDLGITDSLVSILEKFGQVEFLTPTTLIFDPLVVGTQSSTYQTITIRNSGNTGTYFTPKSINSLFLFDSTPFYLDVNETKDLHVYAKPLFIGENYGTITFFAEVGYAPVSVVSLYVNGLSANDCVSLVTPEVLTNISHTSPISLITTDDIGIVQASLQVYLNNFQIIKNGAFINNFTGNIEYIDYNFQITINCPKSWGYNTSITVDVYTTTFNALKGLSSFTFSIQELLYQEWTETSDFTTNINRNPISATNAVINSGNMYPVTSGVIHETIPICYKPYFAGSTSYYFNCGAWSCGNRWTLEAWICPYILSTGNPRQAIMGGFGAYYDWGLQIDSSGYLGVVYRNNSSGVSSLSSGILAAVNTAYHLAASYDGTYVRVYVNGVLKNTSTNAASNYSGYANGFWIGNDYCCGYWYKGEIWEARCWNLVRTGTQIYDNIYTTLQGNESGLVGYWKLDETSGNAVDSSPSGRTGVNVNGNISRYRKYNNILKVSSTSISFYDISQLHSIDWEPMFDGNVKIQLAVRNTDSSNPNDWSYVGYDGTSNTYFDNDHKDASFLSGKYVRYIVFVTSSTGVTLPFSNAVLLFTIYLYTFWNVQYNLYHKKQLKQVKIARLVQSPEATYSLKIRTASKMDALSDSIWSDWIDLYNLGDSLICDFSDLYLLCSAYELYIEARVASTINLLENFETQIQVALDTITTETEWGATIHEASTLQLSEFWDGEDMSWDLVEETTILTAADYTISNLNGNLDGYYLILLQGTIQKSSDIRIGYRPNNDSVSNNYSSGLDSVSLNAGGSYSSNIANIGSTTSIIPAGGNYWSSNGKLFSKTIISASSGIIRQGRCDWTFYRDSYTDYIVNGHSVNSWNDTSSNITSLVLFFNGATSFNGKLKVLALRV
jgi:hypothetical protein